MNRILGIDYGNARVGLAISDPLGIMAQGLDTLEINENNNILYKHIKNLTKEYSIKDIVMGYPINMNGTKSEKTKTIDEIILKLEELNYKVYKVDERLTTVSSYNTMKELGIKQKSKKQYADKFAAMYILQIHLDFKKGGI